MPNNQEAYHGDKEQRTNPSRKKKILAGAYPGLAKQRIQPGGIWWPHGALAGVPPASYVKELKRIRSKAA